MVTISVLLSLMYEFDQNSCTRIYICTCVLMCVCARVCLYMCILSVHVSVFVCIYIQRLLFRFPYHWEHFSAFEMMVVLCDVGN